VSRHKGRIIFWGPAYMLDEVRAEADRHERPMGWVVARAWEMARAKIRQIPSDGEKKK
jgi:uncharacterized small protein (TIGR04563 family)